jgi:preprotein translocase subunit YajC
MINALNFMTDGGAGGGLGSMIPMILIIVAMVAMLWFTSRSNKKQEKQQQNMRDSLQVGDEITTIGGIIGKIVSIKEETLVLETSHDRTRIRILKTAVSRVDVKAEDAQD